VKVIVTGADGQVGRALLETAPRNSRVAALARRDLDITDAPAVHATLERERPDWIFNAAAYTAVDRAEADPGQAHRVNALGAALVAKAATEVRCRVLQISTDFVFSGEQSRPYRPGAATAPINVYGASKLAGENAVIYETDGHALIVRTSWVYSDRGQNFVLRMLELMRTKQELTIVADQVGSPTWATSLARALWAMADRDLSGIHHWSDAGVASWYDFAVAIHDEALARRLLERSTVLRAIRTDEYPVAARRPAYSVLDSRSAADCVGTAPSHWRHNLGQMLDRLATER
jgi:dTDP-4-dehydrorhamnose reductase